MCSDSLIPYVGVPLSALILVAVILCFMFLSLWDQSKRSIIVRPAMLKSYSTLVIKAVSEIGGPLVLPFDAE